MSISREEVRKVARLARLSLDDASLERLSHDVSRILDYVVRLEELDTTGVPPTTQVSAPRAPLRPDEIRSGVSKTEALREAPRADERGFLVPAFVDEGGKGQ